MLCPIYIQNSISTDKFPTINYGPARDFLYRILDCLNARLCRERDGNSWKVQRQRWPVNLVGSGNVVNVSSFYILNGVNVFNFRVGVDTNQPWVNGAVKPFHNPIDIVYLILNKVRCSFRCLNCLIILYNGRTKWGGRYFKPLVRMLKLELELELELG